ncbi:DUF642 domain-containing protein [Luteolibacter yonseiensis]|uniref:DUF642 domain-containing protein n=1 Tax=Luteolibacter yonseiensis TaxID=1144680 RepID=A0A934VAE7_9BACT|nr:DUF642 domain-containing protein [Luteolibacter yonseiensis]MBK1814299.1 DUF642 domain-containing protein [Luteolibacter yonseiensis]
MNRTCSVLSFLGSLMLAAAAMGQYELKSGNFNSMFVPQTASGTAATPSGPPNVTNPPPTSSQFSSMGQVAGGGGPLSDSSTLTSRYPSNTAKNLVLRQVTIGGVFASGVPRFSLGDVITPPLAQADGITTAGSSYWRVQPVQPGEIFQIGGVATTVFPVSNVTVANASINTTSVTVSGTLPASLVVGATILGQPITSIEGNNVTLAGNSNATINSATSVQIMPANTYYYSPHAEKVFASQAGRVTITWVTRVPDANNNYLIRTEDFAVSSNTTLPVRRIYWTEGGFDGPKVQITDSRITTVNPAYYGTVPKAVAKEIQIPGNNPLTPNLTTLSFDKFSGIGQLHAYNVEGRIFIEYLGNVRLGGNIHEFIGSDVVEIVRVPEVHYNTVHLGKEIGPHEPSVSIAPPPGAGTAAEASAMVTNGKVTGLNLINGGSGYGSTAPIVTFATPDKGMAATATATVVNGTVTGLTLVNSGSGYPALTPAPVLSSLQNGSSYYGTTVRPDSTVGYFAERTTSGENTPDDGTPASLDAYNRVVFYWLEAGAYGIQWPKFQDRYWLRWSPNLRDYAHYTVDSSLGNASTGVPFSDGSLPSIIYQDDPAQSEASIDLSTQRLFVNFAADSDQRNRSLLKFIGSSNVWYVNLYSQGEARSLDLDSTMIAENGAITVTVGSTAGLEVGMVVTGAGIPGHGVITRIIDGTRYVMVPVGAGVPVVEGQISNPSFEANAAPAGPGYVSAANSITGWTKAGRVGLNTAAGPFADNGTIPQGSNVAFIQRETGTDNLSTTITGLIAGRSYQVSFGVNARSGNTPTMRVKADGKTLLSEVVSSGGYQVKKVVFTATGATAVLLIENATVSGDHSLLLDNFTLRNFATLVHTVESDVGSPIKTVATVGDRLVAPDGHENAGYISYGTGYFPQGYVNPFVAGIQAANKGAIIPVNVIPADHQQLTVRWFKKIARPSTEFPDLYVPGKIGRYTVSYPATTSPEIVIAQGVGTDDLSAAQDAGYVYYQNDPSKPGYNPNEEHAFSISPRAYALRDDLNITSGENYTSEPFLLLAYQNPVDARPAMKAYKVRRSNATYDFDYTATAGTLLVKPYPLPLMPAPMVGTGANRTSKDLEIIGADAPANGTVSTLPAYKGFTFKDRKGFTWIHRGPHTAEASPTLRMKLYYPSREGFFIPYSGEPEVGTLMPFLRRPERSGQEFSLKEIDSNADGSPGGIDEPLTITYRPAWPADAPELRVAETLTLPKFGLPQVRGQASTEIFYQQSIANAATASAMSKHSVVLHDPTREKVATLASSGVTLAAVPSLLKTTSYQGRTYFQGLPAHLQQRFYYDPNRGTKGTLVLAGAFHDEPAGEDYLDLNTLAAKEVEIIKALLPTGTTGKSDWDSAIDALKTQVDIHVPDPSRAGSYVVGNSITYRTQEIPYTENPNIPVDSYALTASGKGSGYVTMVFGNGGNPDQQPQEDPVQVKVIKVAKQLYVGDLKVIQSGNPLDEQVTLRQSGDFASRPEDYEFEWRWTTGAASAPAVYSTVMTKRVGDASNASNKWLVVRDPGALRPTADQYTAAGSSLPFPRGENVHPVSYVLDAQNRPTSEVIASSSYTDAEAAAGYPALVVKSSVGVDFSSGVPGDIVFSAALGSYDGLVLYVNQRPVLAHNAATTGLALTNASAGLTQNGLSKQFSIAPSYFTAGPNAIEVAVYTTADPNTVTSLDFMLEASQETDAVVTGDVWQTPLDPTGINTNIAMVGSSSELPFGGPQFVLNDRWFTMRYRPKVSSGNVLTDGLSQSQVKWSRWMPPQFVEGWIKRVLAAINPFEQRVKDLYNNATNTDVSVLTQAGTRWEGDVALTMSNINDVGLIAIYETVLNRGKDMSINANTNDPDTNNALTLAAGYLNDLYTILGNEAYADAANPTISLDDQTSVNEVNTSRFSFEGQVASSLEEELAMLRGRDDFLSPGVSTAPAYNRLYWNYTRGINSGEVIYAVNYNVKEKVGGSTADGVIDESDAQRMFPQGHGDAYGHYLTALTGYYRLLTNSNFTWTPRAEAVTVLGQPVTVDYMDERKFAAAASNIARTAQQICALVFRQSYKDDPSAGWSSYRDSRGSNPQTGITSRQGLDEWVSRSTQGAYLNWAVANAMVPDHDISHSGVQKIDRTTVPEISQLVATATSFQTTIDNANSGINPLGLTSGTIAFDLSPSEMKAGNSQFEQVYSRSLNALVNASGAFNQASRMTRSLRNQQNQIDDYNTAIVQQERAYVNQLIDIFGRPYSGDVGAGKTYAQGYVGPDTERWFVLNRPSDLVDTTKPVTVTMRVPTQVRGFTGDTIADVVGSYNSVDTKEAAVTINPNRFAQFAEVMGIGGTRPQTGSLQEALLDSYLSQMALLKAANELKVKQANFTRQAWAFSEIVSNHRIQFDKTKETAIAVKSLQTASMIMTRAQSFLTITSDTTYQISEAAAESLPKSVGLATDATAPVRGSIKLATSTVMNGMAYAKYGLMAGAIASEASADVLSGLLKDTLQEMNLDLEEKQLAYEMEASYRDLLSQHFEFAELVANQQRADQKAVNLRAEGDRILAEREVFRQRAAAVIQGYRTRDLGFRIFRNEALEQYRSLFDLASRYSYLAAKSYDYETGLLGTARGQEVFDKIIASRSLGDLTGGVPQSTVSTLGDAGLAGTMAQLKADFSVAEGRLGINNPDEYGTVFSLRKELFRLLDDPSITSDENAWQQTLERHIVANVLGDSDVAAYCRIARKPDGTAIPGIVIPFSTTIQDGKNFFGLSLAGGDHAYTPSNFATKIYNVGVALPGYVGMDTYATGNVVSGTPANGGANSLSATPYAYLIPCGSDYMLAPPLGDNNILRAWQVKDQALPLPYNLGANDFNSTKFFNANGTLSEQPWILRKHQAFRMVPDASAFYSSVPAEFTNSRLIGRSVWNSKWKLVIPANTLSNNEQDGLSRFAASVKDIQLFLRTYSNSGN